MEMNDSHPDKVQEGEANPFLSKALVSFRWTSFFPVALIALLCSLMLFGLIIRLASPAGEFARLVCIILNGGVSAAIFVWVGSIIAPMGRFRVAVVLTILFTFMAGITIYAKALQLAGSGTMQEIAAGFIAGGIAAILVCIYWYRQGGGR